MHKPVNVALIISSAFILSGCYQDVSVTLHTPGEYKGRTDPLLAKLKTPGWQNKLSERFKLSQSDR
jgi:hypothetical protein